jgi:hypothetical protein
MALETEDKIRLSDELKRMAEECSKGPVTVFELLKTLGAQGHSLVSLFFAFPFLLPMPLPGLSIPFGLVIAFAGFQMVMQKKPWLPDFLLRKELSSEMIGKVLNTSSKILKKMERFFKPRGHLFHSHPWLNRFNGLLIAFCGITLALPLPPGTNFPPAFAIVLLSIGALEKDGLMIVLGYLATLLNVVLFSLLAIFGYEGVKKVLIYFG